MATGNPAADAVQNLVATDKADLDVDREQT
jgi:hypothetical protein